MTPTHPYTGGERPCGTFNPSPYRYSADSLHIIARKLEAEPDIERRLLGAGLRRMADRLWEIAKEDEGRR